MSLVELVAGLPHARWVSRGNPRVSRVTSDSRKVRKGDVFVAVCGPVSDGHDYVGQAVAAGASALVVERAEAAPADVPTVAVGDSRQALGWLAHRMAGDPTSKLTVCGVTGTNGKTTTTYMLRSILERAGRRVGLLGTIAYEYGGKRVEAPNTTPGAADLAACFAEMVDAGMDAAVMEVSSHALDQMRTEGVRFRVAGFTNLTPEHLDYHKTMEAYREAKGRLFAELPVGTTAVLNRDDKASEYFAAVTAAQVTWYAMDREDDVWACGAQTTIGGTHFALHLGNERAEVKLRLLGRHNVYNAMTAAGMAAGLGLEMPEIVAGLEGLRAVPGRLEPVVCGQPFAVLVDYAHTDDALENSLSAVRPLVKGRLIVVFGCGGDRDRTKRPRMAVVAEKWGDVVIATSDNPRTEDPEAILDEVFKGFAHPDRVIRAADRQEAIRRAVGTAEAGDAVVIAGKGHEDYQIIGKEKRHFDDREEASKALEARGWSEKAGGVACGR